MTRLDRPFAVVTCDAAGRLHLSAGSGRQRILYLHGAENGVYVTTLMLPDSGGTGPRGNWLQPADALRIAAARLRTWIEETEAINTADDTRVNLIAPSLRASCAAGLEILLPSAGTQRIQRRLRRRLTVVGRGPQALVQIDDPSVSSVHCVLYQENDRLWVIDLESGAGTRVNGQVVSAVELFAGDVLQLGSVRIRTLAPGHSPRAAGGQAVRLVKKGNDQFLQDVDNNNPFVGSMDPRYMFGPVKTNSSPNSLHGQSAEMEARLEAPDRHPAERERQSQRLSEALVDEPLSLDQLLAEIEQRERPWQKRLDNFENELTSLRTAIETALEEMGQRLRARDAALDDLQQGLSSLEAAGKQHAEANRFAAQEIERCRAEIAATARTTANLKEALERINLTWESRRAGEGDRPLSRLATLEENQRALAARLEDAVSQIVELKDALLSQDSTAESSSRQHAEQLATLNHAIDDVKRDLAKQAESNQECLHRLHSEQRETAKRVARMSQEWFARLAALEVFGKERVAPSSPDDGTGDALDSDSRETVAEAEQPRRDPPSSEAIRREIAVQPEPAWPTSSKAWDNDQGQTTDRLLNRQLKRDAANRGHWRRRLSWSIVLVLTAAGAAALLQHFGIGI